MLENVGGVFIVLIGGSALAVVCAFIEMILDVWTIARTEKVTLVFNQFNLVFFFN